MLSSIRARDAGFSGLLTDLYELTMAAGYIQSRLEARASFELFVRHLPAHRNYLVAAGLEQALEFLENVGFTEDEIAYLRDLPLFRHLPAECFERLAGLRFTGDVWALPEGTIFFSGEPLLRVTAPVVEAQLMETGLLAILHLQTLIASKAARVSLAAAPRPVIEFGARRAHGIEAAVLAARAAYLGGCEGSSNTFAGYRFGIPVFGTQAHSWIMAHHDERTAFERFLDTFPEGSVLLVDTYNVHTAIEGIIAAGRKPRAVRLDSGDVLADSQWARRRLDQAGWNDVSIFLSGDLDENRIEAFLRNGGCADSFGVGTALTTSSDAPALGVIYKLVEMEEAGETRPTAKFSEEKKTYPGCKQVFRFAAADGTFTEDVIGLEMESFSGGEPLLVPVMRVGRRVDGGAARPAEALSAARQRFLASRKRLPARLLVLSTAEPPYPVRYSEPLEALSEEVRRKVSAPAPSQQRRAAGARGTAVPVLWAVDLQADFMLPGGKLYVPGAEKIIPNVQRLVEAAQRGRFPLVSEADAHSVDDPEMRDWPSHCLEGSPGAELIPEASLPGCLVVPNRSNFAFPEDIGAQRQLLLKKNTLNVFDNPNTEALIARLRAEASPAPLEFVVFGVVTEYCVRYAAEGLLSRGDRVALVQDAIQPLDEREGERLIAEWKKRGVRVLNTEEALALAAS